MKTQRGALMIELVTVLSFCAFFFFYGLGSFGLVGADEPRYAQIAREMLARHDWVTPILNGVPWLEKPVLYYWGAMVSYSVFGAIDWAARVPTAFFATMMVVGTYGFMRRFRPGSQLDAALVMTSLAGVIGFSRAASTDMPLTAMFTIGMLAWFAWHTTEQKRFLAAFYVFMALAALAKGPVAPFLAALIIVVFAAARREWKLILRTLWVPGILLFLLVGLPWFVLVQRANPQFVHIFIFEHNLARFGTNMFRHSQPFWYYVPVLAAGLLPWLVFIIAAFVRAVRESIRERSSFELFFLLWAVLPVVFFSTSQSKLPGYILPAVPPFAILVADRLYRRTDEGNEPAFWTSALHAFVVSGVLGGALLCVYFILGMRPTGTAIGIAVVAGIVCFISMMAAIYGKGLRTLRIATLIPVLLGMAFVIKFATPSIDAKQSQRPVQRALAEINAPACAVYGTSRVVEYGLNFYRSQPIADYGRGEIPSGSHVVVTPANFRDRVQLMVPGRTVTEAGTYEPQRLAFYLIGPK